MMGRFLAALAAFALIAIPRYGEAILLDGGTGFAAVAPDPGAGVTVVRTIANETGTATGSTAFWTIGYYFKDGDVPAGTRITTASLGTATIPVSCVARKFWTSGALRWCQMLIDFGTNPINPGGSQDLTPIVSTGSWNDTTTRTNANWAALGDVLTLSGLSANIAVGSAITPLTGDTISGSGTWICTFDNGASNTVETYGSSPQGLFVEVTAQCKDGANIHRNIFAVMDYWVTQTATGGLGPIQSRGPFIFNTNFHPTNSALNTMAEYTYAPAHTRGGNPHRSFASTAQHAWSVFSMTRPDGQADWTANDPGVWVSAYGSAQTLHTIGDTRQFPPMRNIRALPDGTGYTGGQRDRAWTNVTEVDTTLDMLRVADRADISVGMGGGVLFNTQSPIAVEITTTGGGASLPGGITAGTAYWASANAELATLVCSAGVITGTTASGSFPFTTGSTFIASVTGSGIVGVFKPTNVTMTVTNQGTGTFTFPAAGCAGSFDLYHKGDGKSLATASPTGVLELGNSRLVLYTSRDAARSFGATGKVNLTSAGSCLTTPGSCRSQGAVAPGSPGQLPQQPNPTGNAPFLAVLSEQIIQYFTGNDLIHQRNARVNTIGWAGMPLLGTDGDSTATIPPPLRMASLMPAGDTPSGLNAYSTVMTYGLGGTSSDINGGVDPCPVHASLQLCGGWQNAASHTPNGNYLVWLAEGTPILRNFTQLFANGNIARTNPTVRNTPLLTTGRTYYTALGCTQQIGSIRAGVWGVRNKFLALASAPESTFGYAGEKPIQDYWVKAVENDMDFCNHYHAYQGSNSVGVQAYWEFNSRPPEGGAVDLAWFQPDQEEYLSTTVGLGDWLTYDLVPAVRTLTTFLAVWHDKRYNNPTEVCPRMAMSYTQNVMLSSQGDPSPGVFISSYANLGFGTGGSTIISVSSASPAVATSALTAPWGGVLVDGDIIRLVNYSTADNKTIVPWFDNPADGWTKDTNYYVRNKAGSTFNLSKTPSGALMNNTGVARGPGAWFVWQPANGCIAGVSPGSGGLGQTSPTAIATAAMAIMERLGLLDPAAWDAGDARNPAANYNQTSAWGWKAD